MKSPRKPNVIFGKLIGGTSVFSNGIGVAALIPGVCILLLCYVGLLVFRQLEVNLNSELANGYTVLAKPVSVANTVGLANSDFTDGEIADLKRTPDVTAVVPFISNNFKAMLANRGRIPFSTLVFLEAVPTQFIDCETSAFRWRTAGDKVPIIIGEEFLTLYNAGFAPSQGLPQISEGTIKLLNFELELEGPGGKAVYKCEIVGFSKRYNTILVPEGFINWANKSIAQQPQTKMNRLLVVAKPGNWQLAHLITQNGYNSGNNSVVQSKLVPIANIALGGVATLGLLLVAASMVILIQSLSNKVDKLSQLLKISLLQGYTISAVVWQTVKAILIAQMFAVMISFIIVYVALRHFIDRLLDKLLHLSPIPVMNLLSPLFYFLVVVVALTIGYVFVKIIRLDNMPIRQ